MAKPRGEPLASEITPEGLYLRRRELIKNVGLGALTATGVGAGLMALLGESSRPRNEPKAAPLVRLPGVELPTTGVGPNDPLTSLEDISHYNNYYEFGTGKDEPAENVGTLRLRPWQIAIEGEVHKPQVIDLDALLKGLPLQDRVYRMRCVEAWSMVIPWVGFPLRDLIKRVEPTSRAKYVQFLSLHDPEQMPGQKDDVLPWPYLEGLRIDEAMHPLTLLAVGLYGRTLPGQNGAPIRLVVPWKYGFKGIKAVVKLRFTETRPRTTWNAAASEEYGFFANVNPEVDHPRWSQATERRIGEVERRRTLPYNGYAAEVASLYRGLDLRKNF